MAAPVLHATPGPWLVDGDRGVIFGVAPGDNGELPICQLLHDHTDGDRGAADARLIRAALPLLEALEALLCEASCDIEATDEEREAFDAAVDAAIAAVAAVDEAIAAVAPARDHRPGQGGGQG